MSYNTTTLTPSDNGVTACEPSVPQIIVSPPRVDDTPCLTNRSSKHAPPFIGSQRRHKFALTMPPLKGMKQPVQPVVVDMRVKVSLGSNAAIVYNCSTLSEDPYAFPGRPDGLVADIVNNAARTSRAGQICDESSSPHAGFVMPKFLGSTCTLNDKSNIKGRPRRKSGV